jgi:transposase
MLAQKRSPKPTYSMLENTVKKQAELLEKALFRIADLERLFMGTKSERFVGSTPVPGAPTLFDPEPARAAVEALPETVTTTKTLSPKSRNEEHPGRKLLPPHLPREVTELEPEEDITGMKLIGEEVTEILDYTPGKLFVRQYLRKKYARLNGVGIVSATLPEEPITRGMAGAGLLTQFIIAKFIDGMPIYRQLAAFKRENGVDLSPATVSGWLEAVYLLLEPLYDNLTRQALAAYYLQIDETRMQVLDRKEKGKSHRGWIWAYHAVVDRLVLFDYAEGRGQKYPAHHLKHFQGYLQTDGYAVYDDLGAIPGITHALCWAHARREFFDAQGDRKDLADYALQEIGRLYDLERTIKSRSHEERYQERQEKALPILVDLKQWMEAQYKNVLPQSPMGKALAYSLKRWKKLEVYTQKGYLEIDSNRIENAIRPIAVGRKAFLFAGSHDGAKRAAMFYSFMGTCKKNNVEPFEWLKNTLTKIPTWPANRLHELLPNYTTPAN